VLFDGVQTRPEFYFEDGSTSPSRGQAVEPTLRTPPFDFAQGRLRVGHGGSCVRPQPQVCPETGQNFYNPNKTSMGCCVATIRIYNLPVCARSHFRLADQSLGIETSESTKEKSCFEE
jgi:hypothetical protein